MTRQRLLTRTVPTRAASYGWAGRGRSFGFSSANRSIGRRWVSPWIRTLATVSSHRRASALSVAKSEIARPARKFFFT